MRVLHVNEHLDWRGGVETYLLSLLPDLEERGHGQAVVFAEGNGSLASCAYRLPSVSQAGGQAETEGYAQMARILREDRPDVVHLHQTHNRGVVEACLEQVPTVVTAHDYRYVCPASTFYFRRTGEICHRTCGPVCFATTLGKRCMTLRPKYSLPYYRLVRWFARNAGRLSAVIAPSDYTAGRFVEAGFPNERVTTLPYFCPIEPLEEPRRVPEHPTVLFIGRIRESKGWRYFLDALALLPSHVRGILVGDVSPQREADLQRHAVAAGCAARIECRPWVDRQQIADVYREASVFVFPSTWPESLGIVGLEALACGVPVVAADVGGVRQWLHAGSTGVLAPPRSAQALAEGIFMLLESPLLARQMGANGIRMIREDFSRPGHVERLLGIYRSAKKR